MEVKRTKHEAELILLEIILGCVVLASAYRERVAYTGLLICHNITICYHTVKTKTINNVTFMLPSLHKYKLLLRRLI